MRRPASSGRNGGEVRLIERLAQVPVLRPLPDSRRWQGLHRSAAPRNSSFFRAKLATSFPLRGLASMSVPNLEAERFRREAERCRRLAAETKDPTIREQWLAMATEYERLASRYEAQDR